MSREEEKLNAADEYVKNRIKEGQGRTGDVFPVFIEGIEWADANPDRNTFACISLVSAEQAKKQMVDKACKLLVDCIEDFMARRMEIWDKECKQQTLDNIRKAMEE